MPNLVRNNLDKTKAMLQGRGTEPEIPIKTLPALNNKLWGLHSKKLTIIGARTSQGKSALALQLAWDTAKQGIPTLFLSLEMYEEDIIERLFCLAQRVDNYELLRGNFDLYTQQWEKFERELENMPIVITDMLGKTWDEVDKYLTTLTAKPKVIIIDHLQEARSALLKNQKEIIEEYLKKLRLMAIRDNFSIVICSQVNRSSQDEKVGSEPQLHHLKASGFIEECVSEDTLIYNIENNKYYTIKEIYQQKLSFPIKMIDTKTARTVYQKPNKIFDNGLLECYKVTTENGKEIVVSDTARFYDGKWRNIKDLKIGDKIYVDN